MLPQNIDTNIDNISKLDFSIKRLGEASIESGLKDVIFVDDSENISYCADNVINQRLCEAGKKVPAFLAAGPRRKLFHDAPWSRAAIVTCGGLCPGLNDVIKALVNTLWYIYGVDNIYGIQYGLAGLVSGSGLSPVYLNPDIVDDIHMQGGTILGASRGEQSSEEIVRTLDRLNINMLFMIGGDGTQRAAHEVALLALERGVQVSVIGIPKTIDNDLNFMDKTFGFESAVEATSGIISCAHNEAKGYYNGIGLIRLMGRDSGFIAASASLANSLVNFCLIPEVELVLHGEGGLLQALEKRLENKHHAVVVVAEGAGQNLMSAEKLRDKSGNVLHNDIGVFLRDEIRDHFAGLDTEVNVKYFDPSYEIRSIPASGIDSIFCLHLAQHAVHAAMAGMTDLVVGNWHGYFTYVPITLATSARRKIDPHGQLWQSVLLTTRQMQYLNPGQKT
ncbi:MAG: ATP-dependent 6-phosphofructokinase [Lentisphaeria bacterium]|nr:ATP-dependent 6-phosphofructokinase [Lentisphaeria bacterium]MDY0176172.1 ATP-dependent 6-phosphofructokinase [Lentisphaeria bacterium]NLZ59268.1 ATP-dependent 6-phosphofructokinase [Lentisphaerota bacterium]